MRSCKTDRQKTLKIDFIFYASFCFLAFILFRTSDLDFWAANHFFHPEATSDMWAEQNETLWKFFYHAAPWLTGVLLLGSLVVLSNSRFVQYRIYAIFIFLVITLGPGLVVNSIFKPYWGRPRPREVVEYKGKYQYRPFYVAEFGAQGKSFPCGHCSVGFSYGVFYFINRRRNKKIAYISLVGAIAFGFLMGVGRIAAGGHFLSDVVWAGLMTWGVALWLYHFVLKIPDREDGDSTDDTTVTRIGDYIVQRKKLMYGVYASLAALTVTALLLASPFHKEIQLNGYPTIIEQLEIDIQHGDLSVKYDQGQQQAFTLEGYAKGFGFPKNKVVFGCEEKTEKYFCYIKKQGFFSDYESVLVLRINPQLIKQLKVSIQKGDFDTSTLKDIPTEYEFKKGL